MSKTNDQVAPTSVEFPKKWNDILKKIPDFLETADAANVDDLKKIIVESEGNIYTIEQEKAADMQLNNAKELVKEYAEKYKEGLKAQTAKIKYALFLLEGKGVDLDNKD